jgi:hypothetical protein
MFLIAFALTKLETYLATQRTCLHRVELYGSEVVWIYQKASVRSVEALDA